MKCFRNALASRAAAAALVLALAACEDGISTPRVIAGHWFANEYVGVDVAGVRTEDRLELQPDGDYVWTTAIFGPGGRASDGMVDWYRRGGEWGVDAGRLALRTVTGTRWNASGGASILDFRGEWEHAFNLRREGERLLLETRIPPNVRLLAAPRTYDFQRVANFDDAPQPPMGPF